MFKAASDFAEMDTEKLLFASSAEELQATDKTQVAVTLANLAAGAHLRERGVAMDGCAGFSLGEYAALCEAGIVSFEDVFSIVKIRGMLMEKAARTLDSEGGSPGMAAVLGMPAEKVAALVEPLAAAGAYPSNFNSPGQVVVSGTAAGLAKAEEALKAAGAKRFLRLKVSGPFHCPLMEGACKEFDDELRRYAFSEPRVPVYSNVTGKRIRTGAEAKRLCAEQLVSPVRWVAVEESLREDGFERFLEAGPGTVLTGLMRALAPAASCAPAGKAEEIGKLAGG
jgi:[acyl-carrier-protein] S-malonyltransferase